MSPIDSYPHQLDASRSALKHGHFDNKLLPAPNAPTCAYRG
ncbi:hypothetical protein [Maricaulis sp.]|nr:hypothetical protein [Maricaulis sp.]